MKLPSQFISSNVSELPSVGAVFLHSPPTAQLQLRHQSTHRLVVHEVATATDSSGDAAIAITPLVSLKQLADLPLQVCVFVPFQQRPLLIVERAASKTG